MANVSIDMQLIYDVNGVDKSDWRRGRDAAAGVLHLFQFLMTTCC